MIQEAIRPNFRPDFRRWLENFRADGDGGFFKVPIKEIAANLRSRNGEWPRSCGGRLFALTPDDEIRYLDNGSQCSTYLQEQFGDQLNWMRQLPTSDGATQTTPLVTFDDLFNHLQTHPFYEYGSIERLPHFPDLDKVFYLPYDLPPPDGHALQDIVKKFNPLTPHDRDLMFAAMLTPFWGGPPGKRPMFLFTGGVSSGKSITANEIIAHLAGGYIRVAHDESQVSKKLINDQHTGTRCVAIDNVKIRGKTSWSSAEWESIITAPKIIGDKLYTGTSYRTNNLTVLVTYNDVKLSSDLLSRCIPITMGSAEGIKGESARFESWRGSALAPSRHPQVVSDIIYWLQKNYAFDERNANFAKDRWGTWHAGVLGCFPNYRELFSYVEKRRVELGKGLK